MSKLGRFFLSEYNSAYNMNDFLFLIKNFDESKLLDLIQNYNESGYNDKNIICNLIIDCNEDDLIQIKDALHKIIEKVMYHTNINFVFLKNGMDFVKKYKNCFFYIVDNINSDKEMNDVLYVIENKKYAFLQDIYRSNLIDFIEDKRMNFFSFSNIPFWFYLLEKCFEYDIGKTNLSLIFNFLKSNFSFVVNENKDFFNFEKEHLKNTTKQIEKECNDIVFWANVIYYYPIFLKVLNANLCQNIYTNYYNSLKKNTSLNYFLENIDLINEPQLCSKIIMDKIDLINKKECVIKIPEKPLVVSKDILKLMPKRYIKKYFDIFSNAIDKNVVDRIDDDKNDLEPINFLIDLDSFNAFATSLIIAYSDKKENIDKSIKCYNSLFNRAKAYYCMINYINFPKTYRIKSVHNLNAIEKEMFIYFLSFTRKLFLEDKISFYELYSYINQFEEILDKVEFSF